MSHFRFYVRANLWTSLYVAKRKRKHFVDILFIFTRADSAYETELRFQNIVDVWHTLIRIQTVPKSVFS